MHGSSTASNGSSTLHPFGYISHSPLALNRSRHRACFISDGASRLTRFRWSIVALTVVELTVERETAECSAQGAEHRGTESIVSVMESLRLYSTLHLSRTPWAHHELFTHRVIGDTSWGVIHIGDDLSPRGHITRGEWVSHRLTHWELNEMSTSLASCSITQLETLDARHPPPWDARRPAGARQRWRAERRARLKHHDEEWRKRIESLMFRTQLSSMTQCMVQSQLASCKWDGVARGDGDEVESSRSTLGWNYRR